MRPHNSSHVACLLCCSHDKCCSTNNYKAISKTPTCFISMTGTAKAGLRLLPGPSPPFLSSHLNSSCPSRSLCCRSPTPPFVPSPSHLSSSTIVTNCQASSAAHSLCSRRLVSSDWHAQCVSWTDLPACVAFLLKFLCQIPNEEGVAGSAWLTGLPSPACLMKRTPVGFIIKKLQITDGGRGVMTGVSETAKWPEWGSQCLAPHSVISPPFSYDAALRETRDSLVLLSFFLSLHAETFACFFTAVH